ncbi:K+-transporting ATPase ATPase C chain [Herbihabitans rhizosphaerae]|uniref:Potassium-transporting ATPase KdpC subunit n=1 Tax=Herbihabitans rhizosphaerae TaxID=1872711 RepID=A0A4Q7KRY8_9PSEU|nr:potassium-transporting ATPase subunit C [Herbihabitans rhizosphaerae]RZS39314.1 K+-transporting ATPase ATPase C chain [Herbihabitans rhizosphaerae]
MRTYWHQTMAGLRVLLVLTVLTGVLYPLGVWAVSRIPGLHANAEGSVIEANGQAVGSGLIGIDPVPADPARDPWFHTRPSATGDPSTSGGSNKGAGHDDLVKAVAERRDAVAAREGVTPDRVPADAVTASASGVDPHVSVTYAELQAPRVARETGLPLDRVRALVQENTTGRGLGVLGEPGVNVTRLNLAVRQAVGP